MSVSSNKILIENLIEFGLSNKEARVYVSLLEFGAAAVNQIAKASGINRSSTYVVLDSLMAKGLVSISDDKNIRQYIPTSPDMLKKTADELSEKQERIKKNIHAIIPDLKGLYGGMKQRPVVRVFEGKDGLLSLHEDTLESKERTMRVVSSIQNLLEIFPEGYFPDFSKRRNSHKIKLYGIHPSNQFVEQAIELTQKTLDERVIIPEKNFKFPSDMAIYDNKISYMTHKDGGIGILIESKEMAEVMKSVFDLAFEGAKQIKGSKYLLPRK